MRTPRALPLAWALLLATAALGSDDALDAKAVSKVTAQHVTLQGDAVSGVVANTSTHTVRDVKLQITYGWLWKNERHPGTDNPGRTDWYTLAGEIPAGGSMPFTYRPTSPLPKRRDGTFNASATVVGFTEVVPPGQ
jgi:hypothetical protein